MKNPSKLVLIKTLHTLIWLFYNVIIFYLLFAVLTNRIDKWIWICIGLVFFEGVVLAINRISCPLTVIARQYSNSTMTLPASASIHSATQTLCIAGPSDCLNYFLSLLKKLSR